MILQGRAKAAWLRRWSSLLACSMVRAFSESLVERRAVPCTGNVPSAHEMIREDRGEFVRVGFSVVGAH